MSQLINFDAFCVRHLHVDKYKFLMALFGNKI